MKNIADYSDPQTSNAIRSASKSLRDTIPPRQPWGYFMNRSFHRVEDRFMTAANIANNRYGPYTRVRILNRIFDPSEKIDLSTRPHLELVPVFPPVDTID